MEDDPMPLGLIVHLVWLVAFAVALPAPAIGAVRSGGPGFSLACMAPVGGVLAIGLACFSMIVLENAYCTRLGVTIMSVLAGTGGAGLVLIAAGWKAAMVQREPVPPDLRRCSSCGHDVCGINRYPLAEFTVCPECGIFVSVPPS
jgi:hypothetical protein